MNIVVFGPPGIGKGTSAAILAERLGIPKISTGDILREEMDKGSELGQTVKEIVNSGNLVSDELITQIFRGRVSQPDCARGYISDGYPRTVAQARALDSFRQPDIVFNLIASHESLMQRITGRRLCAQCGSSYNVNIERFKPAREGVCDACGAQLLARKDQEPSVVEQRLRVYEEQSKPVIEHYRAQRILADIDAEGMPEDIISSMLGRISKKTGD